MGKRFPTAMSGITIHDVAREAGVSIGSVSKVLNGSQLFSRRPETEARILAAANRLGYAANGAARLLRQQKTNLVGLAIYILTADLNPLVQAVQMALRDEGYEPVFVELGGTASQSSFLNLNMLAGALSTDARIMTEASGSYKEMHNKLPMIALYPPQSKNIDCVTTDRIRMVQLAVKHLVELGHQRIAFADYHPSPFPADDLKFQGWKEALGKFAIDPDPRYLMSLPYGSERGPEVLRKLLEMKRPPTALICEEQCAVYVMHQLQKRGRKIPAELSVVGHGGGSYGEMSYPALTTLQPRVEEIGRIAVARLVQRIEAAAQGKRLRPLQQFIEPTLVVRESTIAPLKKA